MQRIIQKADILIEALPYIQRFRGAVVVVKYGGSAMEDPAVVRGVLQDVVFMECVGMRPVIVHGGGKAINRSLKGEGIEARFLNGLRVTCERTIRVVEQVLKREVNPEVVRLVEALGGRARAVHGDAIFRVTRMRGTDAATGAELDWGYVGEPDRVDPAPVRDLLADDVIPVITPLGLGDDGRVHNVNADVAAAAIARALPARKLVFLSDVPGLLRDAADPESVIGTLRAQELADLIADGTIGGGMLPKCRSGVEALRAGVRKVHMIDGRVPHSLLLEIFTDRGVGTEIVAE